MSSRPRSVAGRFDGLQRVKIEIVEDDDIPPSKKRRKHDEENELVYARKMRSRLVPVKEEEEHAEEDADIADVKEEENSDYVATPATPELVQGDDPVKKRRKAVNDEYLSVATEEEGGEDVAPEEEHTVQDEDLNVAEEEEGAEDLKVAEEEESSSDHQVRTMKKMIDMQAQASLTTVIALQKQIDRVNENMQNQRLLLSLDANQALQNQAEEYKQKTELRNTWVKTVAHLQLDKKREWDQQKKKQRVQANWSSNWNWHADSSSQWERPSQPSGYIWNTSSEQSSRSAWKTPSQPISSSWQSASETESSRPSQPSSSSWHSVSMPRQPSSSLFSSARPSSSQARLLVPTPPTCAPPIRSLSSQRRMLKIEAEKDAKKTAMPIIPRAHRAPRGTASAANRAARSRSRVAAIGAPPSRSWA